MMKMQPVFRITDRKVISDAKKTAVCETAVFCQGKALYIIGDTELLITCRNVLRCSLLLSSGFFQQDLRDC